MLTYDIVRATTYEVHRVSEGFAGGHMFVELLWPQLLHARKSKSTFTFL